jgi:hypothetical protein
LSITIVSQTEKSVTIQMTFDYGWDDMRTSERNIADTANAACLKAYEGLLKSYDTNGEPIVVDGVRMTSKGLCSKTYQTIYGDVTIERHVYQSSKGGGQYCPVEDKARIIRTATPDFAEIIAHKLSDMPAESVVRDLMISNKRQVVKNFVQRTGQEVAKAIQATEGNWAYDISPKEEEVATIGIGADGASTLMNTGDWRMAMAGTIALYDKEGKRLHTSYTAASPEHGKETFKTRFAKEIEHITSLYPNATRVGIADGAADNWTFLDKYTSKQILDFYHATEYLADVSKTLFSSDQLGKEWLNNRCHQLKHFEDAAMDILGEVVGYYELILKKSQLKEMTFRKKIIPKDPKSDAKSREVLDDLEAEDIENLIEKLDESAGEWIEISKKPKIVEKTIKLQDPFKRTIDTKAMDDFISYFKNNITKSRMNYAQNLAEKLPIGSGITESACKTIIKQRLCQSGMRWGNDGMDEILCLRTLAKSKGKWDQFWKRVHKFGFPKT